MTQFSTEELDLAMYMAAIAMSNLEDVDGGITDEQRARLKSWYEAYEASPEFFKSSMTKITEKDLMEHVLGKLGA